MLCHWIVLMGRVSVSVVSLNCVNGRVSVSVMSLDCVNGKGKC